MKYVSLSQQALAIFKQLRTITGGEPDDFVFPNVNDNAKCMSLSGGLD